MLLIYLPANTPRTEYAFNHVFKQILGINYNTTDNLQHFQKYPNEKINYSEEKSNTGYFIKAHKLLFENFITSPDVFLSNKYQTPVLFNNDESCELGFDIFSAIFFMISRYEEYLSFKPDVHGRYAAINSLAYKNNFLQYPVVDKWINILKNRLSSKFPALTFKHEVFNAVITYDIDVAYCYKGRSLLRNIRASFKDAAILKFKNIYQRIKTIFYLTKDPWDTYDYLQEVTLTSKLNSIFFFLLGDYSKKDKNLNYGHPIMKTLVNKISSFSEIGIHPSFKSSSVPGKITIEKQRLENLSCKSIIKSRQHFLKLSLPDSYTYLLTARIKEDYTMGFADLPGFRAGTCKPFYFYDLKKEKTTELKIFPVTCMDATFINYLKVNSNKSLQIIDALMQEVKKVNGTFISIWHNNYLADKNWKDLHDNIITRAVRLKKSSNIIAD